MHAYVLEEEPVGSIKKKTKVGLSEGAKVIFHSRYLGLITILVLAYGISANLVLRSAVQLRKNMTPQYFVQTTAKFYESATTRLEEGIPEFWGPG